MNSPRAVVSVVITCFNQAHYLTEAIESVLAQTFPNVELLVVDDGSGDNTGEIAERYPGVRRIRQANQGLAAARNAGLAACRGEFVVFLDSDDRLLPMALEIGWKELSRHPDCGFVAGSHRMIGFDGAPLWEHSLGPDEDNLYRALLRRNFIAMHAAVMYQRFVFEAVGTFDGALRSTEDYDMYLRVARRCPIGIHPAIVAEYRRHSGSMTRDPALVLRSSLLSLERQRDHAVTAPECVRAYQAGRRFVRGHYGAQLARFVDDRILRREWKAAAAAAVTLLRHYPQGLWKTESSSTVSPVPADIRGRVLEIDDGGYTRKFGSGQVHGVDELNAVDPAFPVLMTAHAVRKAAPAASASPARAGTNGRPIILMYHRIAEVSPDPWGLSVTPAHFAEQLEVLSREARCVPLRTLASGGAARDSVALTFDDGYADNAREARPLLERWDVPATVFVASGCLGQQQFWWDQLSQTIFDPVTLPRTLSLDLAGRTYEWLLGSGASAEDGRPWREWRAWHDDPTPRHYLYRSLFEILRVLPLAERVQALDELRRWAGFPPDVSESRPLTLEEARVLGSCELIELGCHTRTHPMLSVLDVASQREEILGSKRDLADLTGEEPTLFAYPYGHAAAYSDTTVDLVREAGFLSACANGEGTVASDSDRLQLPRFQVHDWSGEELERKLRNWMLTGEPCR